MTALNAPADPASGGYPASGGNPAPGESAAPEGIPTAGGAHAPVARPKPRRGLDTLWLAASSPRLTIALAVALALTLAIAALLPQLPPGTDPAAAGRWLSTSAARYGRFGPFLSSSGLFNILSGPWMIALLALSAFHLALRSASQVRHLAGRRPNACPGGVLPPAPQGLPFELVHLPLPVDAVRPQIEARVSGNRAGVLTGSDASAPRARADAYFERHGWAGVGPLMTYAGPLLVALGLLANTLSGWRVTDVTLIPGRTVQPAQAAGLALSLVDAGRQSDGRPAVVTLARGSRTRDAWLGYGQPAIWGTAWVSQRSSGPALAVKASSAGAALPLQSLEQGETAPVESLHLRFAQNESEQAFSVPGRDLAFRVVSYESLADRGIERPVFLVEGYRGSDPTPGLNELVEDAGTLEWQGVTLALQREAYVVVDLASMPGLPLLLLGGLVLLAGAAVTAWGGFTRAWINAAAERDGTLLAVRVAAPAVGQAEVARVAGALTAAGDDPPPSARRWETAARYAAYTVGGALVVLVVGGLGLRWAAGLPPQARTWSLVLHVVLASLGLGALVAAAVQSLWFALHADSLADALDRSLPGQAQGMRGRLGDPGRGVTLAAFPLLTAAVLLGSVWGLLSFSAPVLPVASEMWLLAAWLLGGAYLHATSGWRPLRVPVWLGVVLVVAALLAGIAAALAASSLFSL